MNRFAGIVISLLLLSPLSLQAQCKPTQQLPVGTTNQGGYVFNYQSWRGPNCRAYRLRNTPGKLLTPVAWTDQAETFFDGYIPACQQNQNCNWIETVVAAASSSVVAPTRLSYGANKDEYKDSPDAIRGKHQVTSDSKILITILRGLIADDKGNAHEIAVQVSSEVSASPPYIFAYRAEFAGKSEPLRILRLAGGLEPSNMLGLLWESANTQLFVSALQNKGYTELSERTGGKLAVEIRANDKIEIESKLLSIFNGNKRIASLTAPAYRPASARPYRPVSYRQE
jgi:hypothetical protein